jgi:hypothetical protein
VRGNQAHVKNADLRHSSFTVVIQKRKFASPVLNVLNYGHATDCCLPCFQIISLHFSVFEELKKKLPVIFIDVCPVGKLAKECNP